MAARHDGDSDAGASLGALLGPHTQELREAAVEREREVRELERQRVERQRQRRLSEGELMALIFAHLDEANPRVCEGIDFDRIVVLASPALAPAPVVSEGSECSEGSLEPGGSASPGRAPAQPVGVRVDPDPGWVGRGWIDDIQSTEHALDDQPNLDPEQRQLLRRARGRVHAELNLRHMSRPDALRHLELFAQTCRARAIRFVRVIPGKGIESRTEPVLKRTVLAWGRGLRWAPELDQYGEWGSLILELSR